MRRMLLVFAVLFVGCAKSDKSASEPAMTAEPTATAISLADVAGTWNGTITKANNDTALVNIELTATAEPTGWVMKVANVKTPTQVTTVNATSVVASGDSIVLEAGPFASVLRPGQQVKTHTVYHKEGDNLVADMWATYPASGEMVALHSVATRAAAK